LLIVSLCSYLYSFFYSFFCFYCSGHHRDLHSFPTRRSSDLRLFVYHTINKSSFIKRLFVPQLAKKHRNESLHSLREFVETVASRSEEHTSELQSRENLVCRLLLEKKKKNKKHKNINKKATKY